MNPGDVDRVLPVEAWAGVSPGTLMVKQWDSDALCVVYQSLSGDTHLLDPLPAELLRLVSVRPRTLEELAAELVDVFSDLNPPDALDLLTKSLCRLQEMGLAQRRIR